MPDKDIFVKVHDNAVSVAAGCYGKVTHENDSRYRIIYAKGTEIVVPIWIDKKDCDEVSPKTEITIGD